MSLALIPLAVPASSLAASPSQVFSHADCGTKITKNVTFRASIDCSDVDKTSLTVDADNIMINLNGYTLTGASHHSVIDTNSRTGVTVVGGTIVNDTDQAGLYVNNSLAVSASKVTFVGSDAGTGVSVYLSAKVQVSNCQFSHWKYGISSYVSSVAVATSSFTDNETGFDSRTDTTINISGSKFTQGKYGIYATATVSVTISNTVTDGNDEEGMYLNSAEVGVINISASFARYNGGDGIYAYSPFQPGTSASSSIVNTVASNNGYHGIKVDFPGKTTLKGNVTDYNHASGIDLGDSNGGYYGLVTATLNSSRNNNEYGFYAGYAVPGSGNRAYGNAEGKDCEQFICVLVKK